MKKLFPLLIIMLTLFSCNRKLLQSTQKTTEVTSTKLVEKDSVSFKDTTIRVLADSSAIQATVLIDENGEVSLPEIITVTPRSQSSVSIKKGRVSVKCLCKEQELKIQEKERLIQKLYTENSKKQDIQSTTKTIEVQYTPKWIRFFAWSGAAFYLLIILYIAFRLIKLYYKPI